MARWLRVWEKKRGQRSTGSQLVGSVGEATFFGILFFLGLISVVTLITSHCVGTLPADLAPNRLAFWLLLVVLGSFGVIGGSGLFFTLFRVGTSAERRSSLAKRAADIDIISDTLPTAKEYPSIPREENLTNSPGVKLAYRLPIAHSPGWRLAATTTFCVVWNSIAIILLVIAAKSHLAGSPEWFLTIFSVPFLAIGLWSINYFFNQMWMQTSIGPTTVEISDLPLYPGGKYQVSFNQGGHLSLKSISLQLICEEEASFHQGTDVRTERHVIFEQQLFAELDAVADPNAPFQMDCETSIPEDAMHSFQADHNAIHWRFQVHAEPERWPQFVRSFPALVYPKSAQAR